MEVFFVNGDKLIGCVSLIKKRLFIKNFCRIFYIKKILLILRMVIYDFLIFMEIYYIIVGMQDSDNMIDISLECGLYNNCIIVNYIDIDFIYIYVI